MRVKINVTQDHIDKGIPGSSYKCPVALAIKETLPPGDARRISVGLCYVSFYRKKGINRFYTYGLPKRIVTFIETFDEKKKVRPMHFTLSGL